MLYLFIVFQDQEYFDQCTTIHVMVSVCLRGPDPGSEFIMQPKNPLTVGPFGNDLLT